VHPDTGDVGERAAAGLSRRPQSLFDAWQVCSVTGSKGERRYAWAWADSFAGGLQVLPCASVAIQRWQ
jgi:hypothetical protein